MARPARVLEYAPKPGRLNLDTIQWMGQLIREGGKREDIRELAEEWLYQRGIPPRDDYREAVALYELVLRRVPYRRDPAQKERVKAPWVSLGLEGGKPYRGEDCDGISVALGALLLAMGHHPLRLRTVGLDMPSHVHIEVFIQRPRHRRGWLALDPVAHPKPPGFRPPGNVEHLYPVLELAPPPPMTGDTMRHRYPGNSYPESDALVDFVRGRPMAGPGLSLSLFGDVDDAQDLAAELEQSSGYGMHHMPLGAVLLGDHPGDEGSGLVYLGCSPLGELYGDAEGGVWESFPAESALGLFGWAKKALRRARRAARRGAKLFRKIAKPAAMVSAVIPGVGTAVSAGIMAADKAAQVALKAADQAAKWERRADQLVRGARRIKDRVSRQVPSVAAPKIAQMFPAVTSLGPTFANFLRSPQGAQLARRFMTQQRRQRRSNRRRLGFLGDCGCQLQRLQ